MEDPRVIKWESFKENYQAIISDDISDDDFGESFDGDEEEKGNKMPMMIPIFSNGIPSSRHHTPWGVFDARDPFSPINMYNGEIYLGHFYKFSVHDIENFMSIMNYMEGVAAWKQIDPHCIAIAVAKAYSWNEVKLIINQKILGKSPIQLEDRRIQYVKEQYDKAVKENSGAKIAVILYPNGTCETITNKSHQDYDIKLAQFMELNKSIQNSLLMVEGNIVK